jgi:multidrug resistance protein MdtO
MATLAQHLWPSAPESPWLWQFLKEELAPDPGRTATVARMTIAATLVMIVCMTFRIPYGFQGAIYALIISRDSPRGTLQSSVTIMLVTGIGAAYVLISAALVISVPVLHFLWVIGSFFLAFFVLSTIHNYAATSTFAIMIAVGVPFWDRHVSAETNVEDTLWLTLAASVGVVVTAAVEIALARRRPGDDIVLHIAERLAAIHDLLSCYIADRPVDPGTSQKLTSLVIRGTSRFRRALRRSDYSPQYRAEMSIVVELVGRLIDIAAVLPELTFHSSSDDQQQLQELAEAIASTRTALLERRIPGAISFKLDQEPTAGIPLLREMEQIVALIPNAFVVSRPRDGYLPPAEDAMRPKFVAADAFSNSEHIQFALKGCLAASLCYIVYNAIAWPGINTAVTTCLLTALSTVGSSRQKQILRFAGALVGGFLLGMGPQVFILPYLDSITGFTVLFILVTVLASWFMTSSPRLSYFGLQVALAFYLINLQEFAIQTSLSIARDRVVGVLFGLLMMWLVFDQLWSTPAAVEMKRTFIANLRLLGQLFREPLPGTEGISRIYSLRETLNANFDKVRSLADGVLFELGSRSRQQDLTLRGQIRQWQPQLRLLFVTRVALLKYRLQLPGFELPQPIAAAQRNFDNNYASALDAMAQRMEERSPAEQPTLENWGPRLERTVENYRSEEPQQTFAAQFEGLLALDRRIQSLMISLNKEI